MNVMAMARQERADLADLLEQLRPEQWEVPSLCTGWRVRDVVAHMISYEEHSQVDVLRRVARARFRPGRINDIALEEYAGLGPEQLIAFLRSHLDPRGTTAKFGGRVALADALIHHQDIRRPLGLPRSIPADRLRVALSFSIAAPPLRGFWHARGVRLVATDLDWSWGRGPEARGAAEATLMALVGRPGISAELSGPEPRSCAADWAERTHEGGHLVDRPVVSGG